MTERRGKQPFLQTLYLIPKVITLGIGCRRDTPRENIEAVTGELLLEAGIFTEAVEQAASIDLKKDEAGIRAFCEKRGWPFVTYTADELNGAEGSFSESDFVREVTGVGSVCERAAVLGSSGTEPGRLIRKKYARDGVTAALAVKKWSVEFE